MEGTFIDQECWSIFRITECLANFRLDQCASAALQSWDLRLPEQIADDFGGILDSKELAAELVERLAELFADRPYRDHYKVGCVR